MALTSKVHLLKGVPLIKNNHVLSFKNTTVYDYMVGKSFRSYDELTFIRNGVVELPVHLQTIENEVNYMMYTNDGSFWFYAFIDSMEYVGDNNTRIRFTVDAWTTYKDQVSIKGFVEREHANYNQVNTLPEDVGLGEYEVTQTTQIDSNSNPMYKLALVITTAKLDDPMGFNGGTGISVKGTSQPYNYYLFNAGGGGITVRDTTGTGVSYGLPSLATFTEIFASSQDHANKIASIKVMLEPPFDCDVSYATSPDRMILDVTGKGFVEKVVAYGSTTGMEVIRLSLATDFEKVVQVPKIKEYTGDSAKMNYYPFSYYELFTGSQVVQIKKEEIFGDQMTIIAKSTLDTDPQKAYVVDGKLSNVDGVNTIVEPIAVNMPVITENVATFMQSQVNTAMEGFASGLITSGIMMAAGGVMVGTGVGAGIGAAAITTGASALGSVVGSLPGDLIHEHRLINKAQEMPNDVSGGLGKLIRFAIGKSAILYHKTQVEEYRLIIGDYFKRFGWKVMRNKTPNLTTRSHFNFVKMKDCIVVGNIPQNAKETIVNLFNEGVTLWHTENIGDYSVANTL